MKYVFLVVIALTFIGCGNESFGSLLKKAEKGNAQAQYDVGMSYMFGTNVSKDNSEAIKWLLRAANQNHVDALYYSALLIKKHDSQEVMTIAYLLMYLAKMNGRAGADEALTNIGDNPVIYVMVGSYEAYRDETPIELVIKAAENGLDLAQMMLGRFYMMQKNYIKAYMWFKLATNAKCCSSDERLHNHTLENLDEVSKHISQEELIEAEKLVSEWKPKTWKELKKILDKIN